jgi:hypothetical protein
VLELVAAPIGSKTYPDSQSLNLWQFSLLSIFVSFEVELELALSSVPPTLLATSEGLRWLNLHELFIPNPRGSLTPEYGFPRLSRRAANEPVSSMCDFRPRVDSPLRQMGTGGPVDGRANFSSPPALLFACHTGARHNPPAPGLAARAVQLGTLG